MGENQALKPATLRDDQLLAIKAMEDDFGAILVASDSGASDSVKANPGENPGFGSAADSVSEKTGQFRDSTLSSHPYARLNRAQLARLNQMERDLRCLVVAYSRSA